MPEPFDLIVGSALCRQVILKISFSYSGVPFSSATCDLIHIYFPVIYFCVI